MSCRGLPKIHPGSSIPELINFVRHSFRECELDKVQNTLMEREKGLKIEILNVSRDCDSLKKDIDLLKSSQSSMNLEKFRTAKEIEELKSEKLGLEAKLNSSHRKCEERSDRIVRLEKEIEEMRRERLSLVEKLDSSRSECKEKDERLVRMEKEIEELWHAKLDSNKTINVLNGKEIEATRTIYELRVRLETALAKMLHVKVEDLSKLINRTEIFSAATDADKKNANLSNSEEGGRDCMGDDNVNADAQGGVVLLPEVGATSDDSSGSGGVGSSKEGGRHLAHSSTKEAAAVVICTLESAHSSAVAEINGIVRDSKGKVTEVKGKASSAAENENVTMICNSDDETYGQTNKRNRRDDSPISCSAKRRTSRLEETDSDDESCSDAYMENLIASFLSKGRNTK